MCEDCGDYGYDDDYDYDEDLRDSEGVNVERLLEELRFVTIFPEKWDQSLWFSSGVDATDEDTDKDAPVSNGVSACGSFGCLAGNTVAREGLDLAWYKASKFDENGNFTGYRWEASRVYVESKEEFDKRMADVPEDRRTWLSRATREIPDVAADVLGLNYTQHDRLFSGENSLDDLWETAYIVSGGQISEADYADAKAARLVQEEKERKEGQGK